MAIERYDNPNTFKNKSSEVGKRVPHEGCVGKATFCVGENIDILNRKIIRNERVVSNIIM